jgi:hypothetical protein
VVSTDFDQPDRDSALFGGTARLPNSLANEGTILSIEVEVDLRSRSVLAVYVSPDLPGLKSLLGSAMVGRPAAEIPDTGIQTLKARYFSPFRNAAQAALLHTWEAFVQFEKKVPAAVPLEPGGSASARPV